MKFDLTIEDFTIILNSLHHYESVEKQGNFGNYNKARINALKDKLARQMVPDRY